MNGVNRALHERVKCAEKERMMVPDRGVWRAVVNT